MSVWCNLFDGCHSQVEGGFVRHEWPAGGTFLEQENVVTDVFKFIADEQTKILMERRKNG